MADIEDLLGKILAEVTANEEEDTITFKTLCGKTYVMFHEYDYKEVVYIESIVGDLAELIGNQILLAEEVINNEDPPAEGFIDNGDSYTWTFYKLATIKGYVDIRWFGSSNGYYSETVDFKELLLN